MPKIHRNPHAHCARTVVGAPRRGAESVLYPVYPRAAHDSVLCETPLFWIDAKTREEWLSQGSVRSVSRGKSLRLMLNLPPRVQRSVSMGPNVVEGNAANKTFARAIVEAWRPQYKVTELAA